MLDIALGPLSEIESVELLRALFDGERDSLSAWMPARASCSISLPCKVETSMRASSVALSEWTSESSPGACARSSRQASSSPWPGPPDELWNHIYEIAIPLRPLFDGLPGDERASARAEAIQGFATYHDGKTVNVPASIVTVSAST